MGPPMMLVLATDSLTIFVGGEEIPGLIVYGLAEPAVPCGG